MPELISKVYARVTLRSQLQSPAAGVTMAPVPRLIPASVAVLRSTTTVCAAPSVPGVVCRRYPIVMPRMPSVCDGGSAFTMFSTRMTA